MKNNKLFKGFWLAVVACTTLATFSCKDEPDAYKTTDGKPTISYIRPVAYAQRDSILHEAYMGSSICIVGQNLRSIKKLNFNDLSAVLNTSYMTDNTVIVTVPNELPSEVTEKIYFITTGNDTVTYDFHVAIPAPTIVSMSNEWAAPGEEVTIVGDYFFDDPNIPLTVSFGEEYSIPRSAIKSFDKHNIIFTMPEGVPHELINVTSAYGSTDGNFMYMDNRGMLFDFDTPCFTGVVLGSAKQGWHDFERYNDEFSLSGTYMQLGNGAAQFPEDAKSTWDDTHFSFEYWCGDWQDPETYAVHPRLFDVADFSDFNNLNLKFEMYIPSDNPWSAAPMQIYFGGVTKITNGNPGVKDIYGNTLAGCNNTFFHEQGTFPRALYMPWNNTDDKLFHTSDKWMTVTIPMSDFNMDYDGTKLSGTYTSSADFASFNIFVIKGNYNDKTALPNGKACKPIIKIDNIRVVPNR
ncbi:MAG: hypothetical protein IJ804_01225 [Prevotella sp.]|nr:hypothetical protein [Prevotella sp.]MBR1879366.1 hypothetical protein [Prevotella sp.]